MLQGAEGKALALAQPKSSFHLGIRSFDVQQKLLDAGAVGIPAQLAASGHYPVAGHDDGNRVATARLAHRLQRLGLAQRCRNLAIGSRFAIRDVQHLVPNGMLELGTLGGQGQIETAALSRQIFQHLAGSTIGKLAGALNAFKARRAEYQLRYGAAALPDSNAPLGGAIDVETCAQCYFACSGSTKPQNSVVSGRLKSSEAMDSSGASPQTAARTAVAMGSSTP